MTVVEIKNNEEEKNDDDLRKKLVIEERERYLAGVGKSYSWEEVKDMAINKKRP